MAEVSAGGVAVSVLTVESAVAAEVSAVAAEVSAVAAEVSVGVVDALAVAEDESAFVVD